MKSTLRTVLCLTASVFLFTIVFCVQNAGAAGAPSRAVIVWNGDDKAGGSGWANPTNTSKIVAEAAAGVDGTVGLKWTAVGSEWIGFGWNWFGWYPDNAGTDISQNKRLIFKIKVVAASSDKIPPVDAFTVGMSCSGNGGKGIEDPLKIADYDTTFADGQWHEIAIPLSAFYTSPKNAKFDKKTAWELDIGEWCQQSTDFTVYIDSIGFDKIVVKKAK
jgi:hypothetical protein